MHIDWTIVLDPKFQIAVVAALLTWVLTQGALLIKWQYTKKIIRKGLIEELKDIKYQLDRHSMIYARMMQVYSKGGCEASISVGVSNLFFKQYYKEVMLNLNQNQRLSYQLTHQSIDYLNKQFEALEIAAKKCVDLNGRDEMRSALHDWGGTVKATFTNIRTVQWHINHHLQNKSNPIASIYTTTHESYLKALQSTNDEISNIFENARLLSREDFEKLYDERVFQR